MNVQSQPGGATYSEKRKIDRLRGLADRVAADTWERETDERGDTRIFVRRFDGTQGVILGFTRRATDDEIDLVCNAIDNLTFFLPFLSRAATRVKQLMAENEQLRSEIEALRSSSTASKPADYAAQASILLSKPVFWRFLSEKRDGEVVDDKDAADAALKELLEILSKKELTSDDGARRRWRDLHAEFSAWERVLT